MSAANWPIVIEEGSQFDYYVTLYDSQCSPKDITGWGAKFQVRVEKSAASAVLYEATVGSGITIQPGASAGLIYITLTVAQVNAEAGNWEKAWYDLVTWPSGGSISSGAKRQVEGRAVWAAAVTRP